jgi:hypothetical protein
MSSASRTACVPGSSSTFVTSPPPQIIFRILGPVLTVTTLATLVAYAWSKGKSVTLTNSVTPLLAVVVRLPHRPHAYSAPDRSLLPSRRSA